MSTDRQDRAWKVIAWTIPTVIAGVGAWLAFQNWTINDTNAPSIRASAALSRENTLAHLSISNFTVDHAPIPNAPLPDVQITVKHAAGSATAHDVVGTVLGGFRDQLPPIEMPLDIASAFGRVNHYQGASKNSAVFEARDELTLFMDFKGSGLVPPTSVTALRAQRTHLFYVGRITYRTLDEPHAIEFCYQAMPPSFQTLGLCDRWNAAK